MIFDLRVSNFQSLNFERQKVWFMFAAANCELRNAICKKQKQKTQTKMKWKRKINGSAFGAKTERLSRVYLQPRLLVCFIWRFACKRFASKRASQFAVKSNCNEMFVNSNQLIAERKQAQNLSLCAALRKQRYSYLGSFRAKIAALYSLETKQSSLCRHLQLHLHLHLLARAFALLVTFDFWFAKKRIFHKRAIFAAWHKLRLFACLLGWQLLARQSQNET